MGIVPKTYPGAGRPPSASSLVEGELAINTGDGCLYTKLRDGRVVKVVARGYSDYEVPETTSSSSSVSAHSSTHHTGGSDALTPANIGAPASTTITHIVKLTQAEYNALSSTPATTLYIIS
jgi:hypothetical protein